MNLRHSPEVCLPSGGWDEGRVAVPRCSTSPRPTAGAVPVTRLGYAQGELVQGVGFWYYIFGEGRLERYVRGLPITSRSSHGRTTRGSGLTVEVFCPGEVDPDGEALARLRRGACSPASSRSCPTTGPSITSPDPADGRRRPPERRRLTRRSRRIDSMKRALITGITGQDGSYLAEFLLGKPDYEVHGLVRRSSTPEPPADRPPLRPRPRRPRPVPPPLRRPRRRLEPGDADGAGPARRGVQPRRPEPRPRLVRPAALHRRRRRAWARSASSRRSAS